jgi:hypothetical protein
MISLDHMSSQDWPSSGVRARGSYNDETPRRESDSRVANPFFTDALWRDGVVSRRARHE